MNDFLNQLSQMREKMDKIKEQLNHMTVEGISGNGKIKVTLDGNRVVKSIQLPENFSELDSEELEDLLVIALNDGISKSTALNEQEMQKAAMGMLPGMGL